MTAIREIDLSRPLCAIDGLAEATRCMIVLRWRRRVVGRCWTPVQHGVVSLPEVTRLLEGAVSRDALDCWLHELIGYDERQVSGEVPLSATVAICTRERPDDLRRALAGLMALQRAPEEILVVDNAPLTQATAQVVASVPSVRYVREDRRGLDAARNCALRESRTDIVAFTDDDAVPEPEWLGALLANFQDPHVMCATGLTLPLVLETEAQELFEEHCSFVRGFRRRIFDGQRDNPLAVGQVGAGANMAVRRDTVLRLGGFDERLDAGMPTCSGGDHELYTRLLAAGHSIAYDPAAVSWHRHRRTMEEMVETVYGYGVGVYAMWTGLLAERRELGVLKLARQWLTGTQLPTAAWGADPIARRLARAELRGCLRGPWAWLAARRLRTREG